MPAAPQQVLDVELTGEPLAFGLVSDAYVASAERALQAEHGACGIYGGDIYVNFNALGGGRWAEASISSLPGATTAPVDGIDMVILSPTLDGGTRVDAFDGPNWVSFFVRYPANAGVLAQALIAALDTTAIE